MKKNLIYVKDAAKRQETFRALKKKISDAFSEEGQAAADAIAGGE